MQNSNGLSGSCIKLPLQNQFNPWRIMRVCSQNFHDSKLILPIALVIRQALPQFRVGVFCCRLSRSQSQKIRILANMAPTSCPLRILQSNTEKVQNSETLKDLSLKHPNWEVLPGGCGPGPEPKPLTFKTWKGMEKVSLIVLCGFETGMLW